jgi:hypothetical protein
LRFASSARSRAPLRAPPAHAQEQLRAARAVCAVTLATDEVDHLLHCHSLSPESGVAVVSPGEFDVAARSNARVPALLLPECAVVIHARAHYVVAHVRSTETPSADIYDGLNAEGDAARRTGAGWEAVRLLRDAFLRTRGRPLEVVADGRCARQTDAVTCGLHAARNATFLHTGRPPGSQSGSSSASAAADLLRLARVVSSFRRGACRCAPCVDKRVTRRWATVVVRLAARLAAPRAGDPLLLPGAACQEEDGDVLPLQLPLPKPTSELKPLLHQCARAWALARRGGARTDELELDVVVVDSAPAAGPDATPFAYEYCSEPETSILSSSAEEADAPTSSSDGSASDGSDDCGGEWLTPKRRRVAGSGGASPLREACAREGDAPRAFHRGRYSALAARADAAERQLASARAAAAHARIQAAEAAAAAAAHDAGAVAPSEATDSSSAGGATPSLAAPAAATRNAPAPLKRPLTCIDHRPSDPRPLKKTAANAARASASQAFRPGTTLAQSLRARSDAHARQAAASTAAAQTAARRAAFNAHLHAQARARAAAAAEAELAVAAAERTAAEAATELRNAEDDAAWATSAQARRGSGRGTSTSGGGGLESHHLLARRTPFRESYVRLSKKAARRRAARLDAAHSAGITAQNERSTLTQARRRKRQLRVH